MIQSGTRWGANHLSYLAGLIIPGAATSIDFYHDLVTATTTWGSTNVMTIKPNRLFVGETGNMKRRRTMLIAVAVVAALSASFGAYAYASGNDEPKIESVADSVTSDSPASDETSTKESPEAEETEKPTADHSCGETGEYQKEVEETLSEIGGYGKIFVDGDQSQEDCDAIVAFQKRMGIEPAEGYAGELTRNVANRINESDLDKCEPGKGRVVCVDLTHQTLWVTDVGEIVYGPTVVRTGMAGGYQTTPGVHEIVNKNESEWSKPYKVWLPYWQHFYNGEGLHETTTYLHDPFGSHGCVNLLHEDAVALFDMLEVGDTIHVFGNRPGT